MFVQILRLLEHVCAELRLHLHMALMLILPCHQFLGRVFYPRIRQKLIALDLCKSVHPELKPFFIPGQTRKEKQLVQQSFA